jgi:flagellar basal body P-ring formation protein FlgA
MRFPIRLCLWALPMAFGLCWAAQAATPADADSEAGPVVVTLRASASVTASPVCIGNVASLSGGSADLRSRIAGLDLADRPVRSKPLALLSELVAYRIQVAGIERSRFRMKGAAIVEVSPGANLTEDDFLQAARDALVDRFPGRAADVIVSLAQVPGVPQVTLAPRDEVRLEAEPREPSNVPGRCRVDVALLVNGERLGVVPVSVDVKVYQMIAVAARRVEDGETLGEENVRFERRAIEAMGSSLTPKDVAGGRKARRTLAAGQVIPQAAVEPLNADNPVLVKQRDLVKLVARVGNLRVTALGESQQDGRDGDRIRVRNVDSKKEIVGRVAGRGLVEVEY